MLNTDIGPQYVTCQTESSSKHFTAGIIPYAYILI